MVDGAPFGRYRLIELLGRGGMGEVWRAHDTLIGREVALKVLPAHYADDPNYRERFRREALKAASLNQRHVIAIYDVGEVDGRLFVTMPVIEGHDLQTVLEAGPLSPQRAVAIIEQMAKALHAAHKIGLVHRDVKPSNILLDEDDFAYLIDFGIARAEGETGLTSTGLTPGTPSYVAPERFRSGEVAPSSDTYALACVLYQCLTGQLPFPGTTFEQIVVAHLMDAPPKPSASDPARIPASMDEVIATGLAKDPDQRYATTEDLARAARAALSATPDSQTPVPEPPRTKPTPDPPAPEQASPPITETPDPKAPSAPNYPGRPIPAEPSAPAPAFASPHRPNQPIPKAAGPRTTPPAVGVWGHAAPPPNRPALGGNVAPPSPASPYAAAHLRYTTTERASPIGLPTEVNKSAPPQAATSSRPWWSRSRMAIVVALVLLVLAGLAFGRWVIRGNYYVAEYNGMVSIMRGIQGSLLGISLNEPYLVGCLNTRDELSLISYSQSSAQLNCHVMRLQDLRPPYRAQVEGVIPAGSLDEAEAQLRTLSGKALPPCPPSSATPEPTATVIPTTVNTPGTATALPAPPLQPGTDCRAA